MSISIPVSSGLSAVLPPPRAHVRLRSESRQSIPARVLRREHEGLVLVAVVPVEEPYDREEIELEFDAGCSRVRLTGRIGQASVESPELLRMTGIRLADVEDERAHVRARAIRPVRLYAGGDPTPLRGQTVDISGGGLLVSGVEVLRVGDEVEFELLLSLLDPPVTGSARVVRVDPGGARGLVYEVVSDREWRRIFGFVSELAMAC